MPPVEMFSRPESGRENADRKLVSRDNVTDKKNENDYREARDAFIKTFEALVREHEKLSPEQRKQILDVQIKASLKTDQIERAFVLDESRKIAPKFFAELDRLQNLRRLYPNMANLERGVDGMREPSVPQSGMLRTIFPNVQERTGLNSGKQISEAISGIVKDWMDPQLERLVSPTEALQIRWKDSNQKRTEALRTSQTTDQEKMQIGALLSQMEDDWRSGKMPTASLTDVNLRLAEKLARGAIGESITFLRLTLDPACVAREQLQASSRQIGSAADRQFFTENMIGFERRARKQNLSPEQVASTFAQVSRLLDTPEPSFLSKADRLILAQQVMRQAAEPTSISQGFNGTCNVTTIEVRAYARCPAAAAKLIADVACTGLYQTPNGSTVKPYPDGIRRPEPLEQSVVIDGSRTWATRIFNLTAVQAHWDAQSVGPDGKEYAKGSLRYEKYAEYRPDQTGQMVLAEDTSERLVVYGPRGARMVYSGDTLVTSPHLFIVDHEDIYRTVTGVKERGFVVTGGLPHLEPQTKNANSEADLRAIFAKAKANGQLPLIIMIDAQGNGDPLSLDLPEELDEKKRAPHVVTVHGYDENTGLVQIDNQWSARHDHLAPGKEIDVRRLFNRMSKRAK